MPRKKKDNSEKKGYFYEREEEAVAKYISSTDEIERKELFDTILYPAFKQMIESIIRRYNLFQKDEEFEETFNDCISFLMTKLDKFKPFSGFKAYSYCGTICKNYLIYRSKVSNRDLQRNTDYDDVKATLIDNVKYSEEMVVVDNDIYANELFTTMVDEIKAITSHKKEYKLTDNEYKVGMALLTLFTNWEDLFTEMGSTKFTKSSISMFIAETTLLSSSEIRNAMKKYKAIYYLLKKVISNDI